MAKIFFSYSHKDEELRNELEIHLAMLKHQGIIETWHDRRILAGDVVDLAIDQHLNAADIILLLVSPDFLASPYCFGVEMKQAMQRHVAGETRVLPVILRACEWHHAPFGQLLATPKDGKAVKAWPDLDEAFLDVTKAIRAAVGAMHERTAARSTTPTRPGLVSPSRVEPTAGTRGGATNNNKTTPTPSVRSSNLRIRKTFTERDKDTFLESAFGHIANLFEGSLEELKSRNPGIETAFRRIDANHFSAVVYRDGSAAGRCRIWLGAFASARASGIMYSSNDSGADNSWNEMLSVEDDKQTLFLRSMGMQVLRGSNGERRMTAQGAAEFYWSMFIEALQR